VTSLNYVSMAIKYTGHVVGQAMFAIWSKTGVPSTSVSRRSYRLVLLDSKHRLQILQQLYGLGPRQCRLRLVALQHGVGNLTTESTSK